MKITYRKMHNMDNAYAIIDEYNHCMIIIIGEKHRDEMINHLS